MKTELDLKKARVKAKYYLGFLKSHSTFLAVFAILIMYLLVVFKISSLSIAEPSPESESAAITASTDIPKIDEETIEQIEDLEASSSDIKSLFNRARNNPFSE